MVANRATHQTCDPQENMTKLLVLAFAFGLLKVFLRIVTLLKSHFGMGVLLQICCIFSEHIFLRTPLDGCF